MARTSVDITRELWLRLISGEPLTKRTVWNYLESPCVHHFVSGRTCRYLQNPNIGEFISANRLDWTGKVLCLFLQRKTFQMCISSFPLRKKVFGRNVSFLSSLWVSSRLFLPSLLNAQWRENKYNTFFVWRFGTTIYMLLRQHLLQKQGDRRNWKIIDSSSSKISMCIRKHFKQTCSLEKGGLFFRIPLLAKFLGFAQ